MQAVAALAAFLYGPDATDITGAALPIDGGWSAS
jgi:NAD(P)-dependent dehydrogenase (short-subunit alcohol dehydrogenase family)